MTLLTFFPIPIKLTKVPKSKPLLEVFKFAIEMVFKVNVQHEFT